MRRCGIAARCQAAQADLAGGCRDPESGRGGQEALADQRAVGLGDDVKKRTGVAADLKAISWNGAVIVSFLLVARNVQKIRPLDRHLACFRHTIRVIQRQSAGLSSTAVPTGWAPFI